MERVYNPQTITNLFTATTPGSTGKSNTYSNRILDSMLSAVEETALPKCGINKYLSVHTNFTSIIKEKV
jgi:hypothetical protein